MKQGFYMGYDASRLGEDALRRQARLLLDTGLYRAGYRTLRLGRVERFDAPEKLAASLRALGFQLDFTAAPDAGVDGVFPPGQEISETVRSAIKRIVAVNLCMGIVHLLNYRN